jgi:hypothetical protein
VSAFPCRWSADSCRACECFGFKLQFLSILAFFPIVFYFGALRPHFKRQDRIVEELEKQNSLLEEIAQNYRPQPDLHDAHIKAYE